MTQKYRKGDVVTVKAVVQSDNFDPEKKDANVYVLPEGHYTSIFVDPKAVTMVQPYFAPGERVQKKHNKSDGMDRRHPVRGTVLAMHDIDVWVQFDHGKRGTVPAIELEPSTETKIGLVA
jgi:hypothetical protein